MKKNKSKLFIIYILIIFAILVTIMFILPDSFFMKKYEGITIPTSESVKKEFVDYEIQKERLSNNNYNYEYSLLNNKGSFYECSGLKNGELESGTCTSPTNFSYTEKNKTETFSDINLDHIDAKYIIDYIKDIEPEETLYQTLREYKYNASFGDLQTDIIIYTDLDSITKIEISNTYITYIIKYSNINY